MNRGRYEDIIDMPHPISRNHPPMAIADRAAQFSPFAALTGYEDAVWETARLTDERRDLDEDLRVRLNEKLMLLQQKSAEQPKVSITYFVPDARKEGGSYETLEGNIKRIDTYGKVIIMQDGSRIAMDAIWNLDGECLNKACGTDSDVGVCRRECDKLWRGR